MAKQSQLRAPMSERAPRTLMSPWTPFSILCAAISIQQKYLSSMNLVNIHCEEFEKKQNWIGLVKKLGQVIGDKLLVSTFYNKDTSAPGSMSLDHLSALEPTQPI